MDVKEINMAIGKILGIKGGEVLGAEMHKKMNSPDWYVGLLVKPSAKQAEALKKLVLNGQ